ncbi:hypothetical protein ACHAWX_002278 [Stephanocyclus meneghinianus]
MASHLCITPRRQRRSRRRTSPRPFLLLFVLVASPCLDAADSLHEDTDVSFRRRGSDGQEERMDDPSLKYSATDRDGGGDEQGDDDDEYEYDEAIEETISSNASQYRDERTNDNEYRYNDRNPQEYKEVTDENTTITPDIYDPDDTDPDYPRNPQQEMDERSTVRSIDASSSASSSPTDNSKKSAWITHGTLGALSFGLLVPIAVSSALFRDLLPTYWIYLHVFLNVATFAFVLLAVGLAFATMHSLGDATEGHLKELHHIVGLALMLLLAFQVANGFLRPPREFAEDHDDDDEDAPRVSEGRGRRETSPRAVWRGIHRTTGLVLLAGGTWQVQSGLEIFARKFGAADWGAVYLGYMGWVVFLMGGGKLWMKFQETKREGKNPWNAEDELFDTDALSHGLDDD